MIVPEPKQTFVCDRDQCLDQKRTANSGWYDPQSRLFALCGAEHICSKNDKGDDAKKRDDFEHGHN